MDTEIILNNSMLMWILEDSIDTLHIKHIIDNLSQKAAMTHAAIILNNYWLY